MRQAVTVLRRVLIVLALLLGLSALVAIVSPRSDREDDPTPRTMATPAGEDVTATVRGTLPRDKVVRAKLGDLVELRVTSTEPDSAAVEEFALTEGVEPGSPARFSFLADRPGRFDVKLVLSGRSVGRLVISLG